MGCSPIYSRLLVRWIGGSHSLSAESTMNEFKRSDGLLVHKNTVLDGCSTVSYKWMDWIGYGYLRVGWGIEHLTVLIIFSWIKSHDHSKICKVEIANKSNHNKWNKFKCLTLMALILVLHLVLLKNSSEHALSIPPPEDFHPVPLIAFGAISI